MTEKRPAAYVFGLRPWANYLNLWIPDRKIHKIDRDIGWPKFFAKYAVKILASKSVEIYVWGYKHPGYITTFCTVFRIPLIRIEDGFLRSVTLGKELHPPISLCFDSIGMYFNSSHQSSLEKIIESFDFDGDKALMQRARAGMLALVESRLSKYNLSNGKDIKTVYGPKTRSRILVIGQVESDMSLVKGNVAGMGNNDLVRAAADENPDAQIIYKPHPAAKGNDTDLVRNIAIVLGPGTALADAFSTVDRVYTMTSLAGFEALIRGIPVTCFGMPFYAGWGVTDDRRSCVRRTVKRTVEQIFAAAYILYPKYFDPRQKRSIQFEQALELLGTMKRESDGI